MEPSLGRQYSASLQVIAGNSPNPNSSVNSLNYKELHNYSPGASDGRFLWKKYLQEPYLYPPQKEFSALIGDVTHNLQELAATDARVILSTCSGTGGLECAIAALPEDCRILVVRNGYFGDRLWKIACFHFKGVTSYLVPFGKALNKEHKEGLTALLDDTEPDAVLCVHCETSSAALNDVEMTGKLCRERGTLFIVDGVSALGNTDVKMDQWGIDCYVSAAHKALMGMPGLSILLAEDTYLRVAERKWCFYFDLQILTEKSSRNQYLWSPNLLNLYCIRDIMEHILSEGKDKYYAELAKKAAGFRQELLEGGLKLSLESELQSPGFTAAALKNSSAGEILECLQNEYNIVVGRGIGYEPERILRCGHHPFRSEDDLNMLAQALLDAAHSCGEIR